MATDRYERRGVVFPVLLVLAGALLFLENLGATDVSLWPLFLKLWPAILLAIGVDILIPRRSVWGTLLAAVAVLAVLLGAFWLAERASGPSPTAIGISQPLSGAATADVEFDMPLGRLTLDADASSNVLLEGAVDPLGRISPTLDYSVESNRGQLRLEAGRSGGGIFLPRTQIVWDLSVLETLPLQVDASIGAGEMELDLHRAQLEALTASFGVGRAEVWLPPGRELDANIDGGVGQVFVHVPVGSDVRIMFDGGLTSLDLPQGYTRFDGGARSSPTGAGGPEITLRIDLGLGTVRIVEDMADS